MKLLNESHAIGKRERLGHNVPASLTDQDFYCRTCPKKQTRRPIHEECSKHVMRHSYFLLRIGVSHFFLRLANSICKC